MIDSQCDCIQLMMKTIFKIILIILVSTSTVDSQLKRRRNGNLAPVYAHSERQRDKRSEGGSAVKSFIIKLSDNANHSDFEHLFEVLHGYNASLSFIEHSCRWEGVTAGMVAPLNASTLHWVRSLEMVEYVEQDALMKGAASERLHYHQRHLDELDGARDWAYTPSGSGKGVDVYVVDSGIKYSDGEFVGRAKFVGRDFVHRDGDGSDTLGHGTYVASLVAGKFYGVAKAANLFSVKVLNNNKVTTVGRVNEALNYVGNFIRGRKKQRAVVVMAFSGRKSTTINEIVERLTLKGVTVIAASGNKGGDACKHSPASSDSAITVGATDIYKNLWYLRKSFKWAPNRYFVYRSGSAIGSCVDIFATGKHLTGAGLTGPMTATGTSGAAAVVAGVVAVMLQCNTTLTPQQTKRLIIDASLKDLVDMSAAEVKLQRITPNRLLTIPAVSALQSIEAAKRVETEVMQANKTLTKDGVLDQPTSA